MKFKKFFHIISFHFYIVLELSFHFPVIKIDTALMTNIYCSLGKPNIYLKDLKKKKNLIPFCQQISSLWIKQAHYWTIAPIISRVKKKKWKSKLHVRINGNV